MALALVAGSQISQRHCTVGIAPDRGARYTQRTPPEANTLSHPRPHFPEISRRALIRAAAAGAVLLATGGLVRADDHPAPEALDTLLRSVVRIHAFVPNDADSARRLGAEREGHGIVVGPNGLIVTIGYLVNEAMSVEILDDQHRTRSATIVAYDSETGLGLLRAPSLAALPPLPLGDSTALTSGTPVVVAGAGGSSHAIPAVVVSRRPFAGSWEYLLEHAIFTAPAHPDWGGAALISSDGKLLGIGSLLVGQARREGERMSGNVFVPVDLLRPMLDQLAATGKTTPNPHPWLGLNATAHPGGLIVGRLSRNSPAQAAGVQRGDIVTGIAGRPVEDLAEFYREVWAMGSPGVDVPLTILRDGRTFTVRVRSADRYHFLVKDKTY
jgi:S1-C subfamily serine protease